jgi:hypothetical protein
MTDPTVVLDSQLQARLENLEKQLFQIASKGHRTMYRQTEEAAPLAKLEATIRLLDSEFQQFRGTDPKRLIDALVTQHNANFRQEIEERLKTRASEEELLQFQKDIFRIENFTRETQVNVFSLKSKLEALGADLESRFTEQRWSALEASLQKAAAKQQEELQKELRNQTKQQEEQVDTKLKSVQGLLTLLEKEVRTQYGPEMLQEHMQTLEKSLITTVRSSLTDATQQLTSKVSNYEGQTQALRQLVLEAVADMKQELKGAALQARFKAYEDRLAEQEERYKTLGQQYAALETHLKRQTAAAQERQSDLYQELEQTQAHIKELDTKATQAQQQVAATYAKWLKDREQVFDAKYGQTEAALSALQDRALILEEELGMAFQQRKAYEETWKDQYASLQKTLEDKFTAWTDDKTVYLTGRVVDLTQQLQSTINLTKLHQRRVDELLAEENIRGFVTAIETKVRTTQDEWAQRRNTEFSLKFDTYGKQIDAAYSQLETDRQQAQRDKDELMRTLKLAHKEEVARTLFQFSNKAEQISADLQKGVKAGIQEVDRIKAEITGLQETYKQQTQEAITSEKYTEFQEALKKEIRRTFADNQTALYMKHQEYRVQATEILQMAKDQETRLNTLFSDQALIQHMREVEAKVLKSNEDWRTRTQTAFDFATTSTRNQITELSATQKQELDAFVKQTQTTFHAETTMMRNQILDLSTAQKQELDAWLKASEQSKQALFEHLRTEVQNHTTTWFTQRTGEFTTSLETYKAQIQALQKLIIANKDEWVTSKQKEFVVRLAEAVKQAHLVVQQSTEKEHVALLEKFSVLEGTLKQKQESAEKTIQGSLEDRIKPIQVGLQLIQTSTEKASKDIAVLFTITSELQSNVSTTISYRQVADAETLLATLTRVQASEKPVSVPVPVPVSVLAPTVIKSQQSKQHEIYNSLTKCFYTAVFGTPGQRLDTLGVMKPPPGWDVFCFTNQPDLQANGWTIIQLPMQQTTPVLQAKYVKWNSHKLLEDYDVAIWLDAYLAPNLSSTNLLQQWIPQAYTAKAAVIHRKHDARNCVWDECKAVVDAKRDTPEHVEALKRRLTAAQMPKQFGLFDTNMMIKFHKQKVCQEISEAIWSSLQVDTHRDQLVVTPTYYTKGFKAFATLPLQQAFDRSGTHIRNPIS